MKPCHIVVCLAISVVAVAPAQEPKGPVKQPEVPPESNNQLDAHFTRVADTLARYLKGQQQDKIAINFSPKANKSTAGAGYAQMLADRLRKHGVTVVATADVIYKCEFGPAESPDGSKALTLSLEGTIVDALGKKLAKFDTFTCAIAGREEIIVAGGGGGADLHRKGPEDFQREFFEQLKKPRVEIAAKQAKPSAKSPYGIEVLTSNKAAIDLAKQDGFATFEIGVDEEYELRLFNNTDHEAAVSITIDGLSTFHFSEEVNPATKQPYRYYIVPPRRGTTPGQATVEGWFKTLKKANGFRVVPAKESLAAKLGQPAENIGQITVCFRAAWEEAKNPKDTKVPPGEPGFEVKRVEPEIVKVAETITVIENGKPVQKVVYLTKTVAKVVVGTEFGTDRFTNGSGVVRVIGVERDALTLHYVGKK